MHQPQEEERKKRKVLRLFFILGLTVLATAAIGFGGLALWSVTTQNNGNSFATGSVHHQNQAHLNGALAPVTCTDATSPGACGAIFQINGAGPGSSITGSVQITSTGTRISTFTLGPGTGANALTPIPATSNLCTNLRLTIVDNEAPAQTIYNGGLGAFATTGNLKNSAGALNWAPGDTNTFIFTVALPVTDADPTDMAANCDGGFIWTQTG